MISAAMYRITMIMLFLVRLHLTKGTKLSLDVSDILDEGNQKYLYTYNVLSHLNHLATNTFRLRLNPKAKQDLGFLKNVTETGLSFEGLATLPNKSNISQKALGDLNSKLSGQSLLLLQALTQKDLKIPVVLKPTDGDINEFIKFMEAFKEYWNSIDSVTSLEIRTLGLEQFPKEIVDTPQNRTLKSSETNTSRESKSIASEAPSYNLEVSEVNLKSMLENILKDPRNHETSKAEKFIAQTYITMKFEEFGLSVYNHDFSAHETEYLYGHQILGTNVIGVLTGSLWGSSNDKPIVIGAHYDTVPGTSGVIDNASGTAALIEAARILTSSGCSFKNSIFFVAFDLEEIGTQGSFMFVKDVLLKLIFPTYGISSISGAIIMDCVANWDNSEDSQEIPDAWEEKLPGLRDKLKERNSTGDFLAVMYRENPDGKLAERLNHYYVGLEDPEFRVELLPLKELEHSRPNDTVNLENFDFFRSDHYRFWYPSEKLPNISFPALLLTDTGPYRGKMKLCYHQSCDNFKLMQPNIKFLAKVTRAAAWVAADLAEATCDEKKNQSIAERFQEAINAREESGNITSVERPMISISSLLEILHYLGKTDPSKLDQSLNAIKENISKYSIPEIQRPTHRFSAHNDNPIKNSSSTSKLSITIHGKDSTFLIPLRVFHSIPQSKKDEIETSNITNGSIDTSEGSDQTNSANNKKSSLESNKWKISSSVGVKHVRRTTKRNPLETDIGTTLHVQ